MKIDRFPAGDAKWDGSGGIKLPRRFLRPVGITSFFALLHHLHLLIS
jgi:hypothetical protein